MLFTELLKMAWLSLGANKLRTFLTMLGVIIGVTSVIALVSVGMGVKKNILDNISRLGSNMLIVMPGSANRGGMRGAAGSVITLTYDDAEAIKNKIKNVEYVSPTVQGSYQVVYGHENWNTTVTGVIPEYVAGFFSANMMLTFAIASRLSARPSRRIFLRASIPSAKKFVSATRLIRLSACLKAKDNPAAGKTKTTLF